MHDPLADLGVLGRDPAVERGLHRVAVELLFQAGQLGLLRGDARASLLGLELSRALGEHSQCGLMLMDAGVGLLRGGGVFFIQLLGHGRAQRPGTEHFGLTKGQLGLGIGEFGLLLLDFVRIGLFHFGQLGLAHRQCGPRGINFGLDDAAAEMGDGLPRFDDVPLVDEEFIDAASDGAADEAMANRFHGADECPRLGDGVGAGRRDEHFGRGGRGGFAFGSLGVRGGDGDQENDKREGGSHFGFWIFDFGFAATSQSKIQNPKSKIGPPLAPDRS